MYRQAHHRLTVAAALIAVGVSPGIASASSHREAPFITKNPKVDATDFYMFKSYEPGRQDYVTIVANYQPFQEKYGGPNFYTLDSEAYYDVNIDNDGDAKEDITFRFSFQNDLAKDGKGLTVDAGGKQIAVPLINVGPISANDRTNLNITEKYKVEVRRAKRENAHQSWEEHAWKDEFWNAALLTTVGEHSDVFHKPVDYIGRKSLGGPEQYEQYARAHVYDVNIPGCDATGRVFVGQRKESFAVNLGVTFDLVNAEASVVAGGTTREARSLAPSSLEDNNVTTLALELPISCIRGQSDVIGGWTAASVRQVRVINPYATIELPSLEAGAWTQVSRLSMPLVNELVVGLKDKDRFNSSQPKDDAQFADYVTNPSLPELLELLFGSAGVMAPNTFPRADLVQAFLTGVPNVNANGSTAEMMRLNTALPATPKGKQNSLGAAACFVEGALKLDNDGCDPAGFPNGRRPGDDVVDIELRVAMGYLLPMASAPSGQLAFTDATLQEDSQFDEVFPYLRTPNPGAQ